MKKFIFVAIAKCMKFQFPFFRMVGSCGTGTSAPTAIQDLKPGQVGRSAPNCVEPPLGDIGTHCTDLPEFMGSLFRHLSGQGGPWNP